MEALRSYFCRATPDKEYQATYTLSVMNAYLSTISDRYFLCYEQAKRPHFHFVIYTSMSAETLRARLKKNLHAQIYISGKEVEDQVKAVAYCMKDGTWTQSGMDINTLLLAKATTKKKVKFDDLIEEQTTQFKEHKDKQRLISGIIEAHVTCNRKIYMPHIRALVLLCRLKAETDGSFRRYLMDKIIDDM